jgi:hypothetical protein
LTAWSALPPHPAVPCPCQIWVPTAFHASSFAAAGVLPSKLYVIGEPVDTEFFNPGRHAPMKLPPMGGALGEGTGKLKVSLRGSLGSLWRSHVFQARNAPMQLPAMNTASGHAAGTLKPLGALARHRFSQQALARCLGRAWSADRIEDGARPATVPFFPSAASLLFPPGTLRL